MPAPEKHLENSRKVIEMSKHPDFAPMLGGSCLLNIYLKSYTWRLWYNRAWTTVVILHERPPLTAVSSAVMPSATATCFIFWLVKSIGNTGLKAFLK